MVTGASRGLGASMAVALAEAGADVALVDVLPCSATAAMVQAVGRRAFEITAELSGMTPDRAAALCDACVNGLGALHILVNNAGIIRRAPAFEHSEADWRSVLDINLNAAWFLSQAAGKIMHEHGGGKIISTASMMSFQGGLFVPGYTAAKSAIAGITHALANEWAGLGINVNAIAPGYMTTDVTAGLRSDEARSASILARIPAGRWGIPDDLQGTVVFLASRASDYVHGTVIPVDGGWLAR